MVFSLFEQRLRLAISELSFVAELIEISTQIILHSGSDRLIKDTTDNLILTCILNHARSHSSEEKALLTENHKDFHDNQEVQKALREAGIKYFRNAQVCLEWLKARSSPPDSEPSPGSQN